MAKGKSFGDIVKSVLSEQTIEETMEVGGGATGGAKAADPNGGQAPARKGDKRNSDSMEKGQNPDGTPIEDTDSNNNTKPTGDASGGNKATIKAKPSAASGSMKEHIQQVDEGMHVMPMNNDKADSRYSKVVAHAKKMGYNVHHEEHYGDEKSGNKGSPDITVHYQRGDDRESASPEAIEIHKSGKAAKDKTLRAHASGKKTDVQEHIDAIFNNEDLSEDFRTKASTIFEAAVQAQLQEEKTKLEEEFATSLVKAKEELQADLVEKLDQYTTYAAEQWMEENRVAIESSLKSEITEDFINGLKGLFAEHYIEIPEDKVDVLSQMAEKVQELEEKLNSAINENMELKGRVDESVRERILADVSEGLAATQVEKLAALAEGVDFDSADNFKKKLELVKENYFPSTTSSKKLNEEAEDEALALNEETKASPKTGDIAVNAYVSALSRTLKK